MTTGVRGQLTVRLLNGAATVREVPGRDCQEVESAMALIAALMVDPLAGSAERANATAAVGAGPPQVPRLELAATTQPSSWSLRVDTRLTARTAIAPALAWGGSLGVMLTRETSRLLPSLGLSGHFASASTSQPAGTAQLEWASAHSCLPLGFRLERAGIFGPALRFKPAGCMGRCSTPNPRKIDLLVERGLELQGLCVCSDRWGGSRGCSQLPFRVSASTSTQSDPAPRTAWGMTGASGRAAFFLIGSGSGAH